MMGTTDNPGGMKANASAEELSAALKDAIIIAVRSPPEIAKGPAVPGSLNLAKVNAAADAAVWQRNHYRYPYRIGRMILPARASSASSDRGWRQA